MAKKSFLMLYEEQKKKPTAAQLFVRRVSEITHRKEQTVRMWLSGQQTPDELVQGVLAREFGVSASDLFPKVQLT